MNKLNQKFFNPPAAYRGKPFWSWNGKLEKKELISQIENFKDMGMGGYFCHSRTGLVTEYLGDTWFELVNSCADKGVETGLETWLYDEDRWPSGTAGGMVTENPEFRMKYIRLSIIKGEDFKYPSDCIAAFTVEIDGFSFQNKERINSLTKVDGKSVLLFTVEEMAKDTFYNGNTYVDTMNADATEDFIKRTHEQYREKCGSRFGESIKGIFTDEPHRGAVMCGFSLSNQNAGFLTPYTDSLFESYQLAYGENLVALLPELFLWENGEKIHPVKWRYMELTQKLFLNNFMKPINDWCKTNNMLLTGHLLHEDSLTTQTCMIGSIMRAYEFMDYPGVDVLTEHNYSFWIVKQLQSAARQLGKKWMMSELYGCTGWQFDFENHKAVGDWQAFFGINLRCHHLSWVSMQGEAKRDYPASISHQSAWFREYKYIEDYFSRIHVFMEEGEAICDLLVINPVESAWSLIYPNWSISLGTNDPMIAEIEQRYAETFRLLCGEKIDFDYGDEDYIDRLGKVSKEEGVAVLTVGKAKYKSVLITGMITIRQSTLALLQHFAKIGGNVVFAGKIPDYVDAVRSVKAGALDAKYIDYDAARMIECLSINSLIKICDKEGKTIHDIYAHIRKTNKGYHILLMNMNREKEFENVQVEIKAEGFCEKWDARTGEIHLLTSGCPICFTKNFEIQEELLLVITNDNNKYPELNKEINVVKSISCGRKFKYTLSEPNVCVLDFVDYQIDNGSWIEGREILKADQEIRMHLSMPLRGGSMLQPWFTGKTQQDVQGTLKMRFQFEIEHIPAKISLALETPDEFDIKINGRNATISTVKYWVDSCFKVLEIESGSLQKGKNTITLSCDFKNDINLEAIYLLGEFGVVLRGGTKIINKLPKMIEAGDITCQGFPFYGAGIRYILEIPPFAKEQKILFKTIGFEAACIKISDGKQTEIIGMRPYMADVTKIATGKNKIEVEYILTRRKTFGPLHLTSLTADGYGPDTYLTSGESFMYEGYGLLPQGMVEEISLLICDTIANGSTDSVSEAVEIS